MNEVPVGLVSSEASLLSFQVALSCCLCIWSSLYAPLPLTSVCPNLLFQVWGGTPLIPAAQEA
jgi:hypothetical protein